MASDAAPVDAWGTLLTIFTDEQFCDKVTGGDVVPVQFRVACGGNGVNFEIRKPKKYNPKAPRAYTVQADLGREKKTNFASFQNMYAQLRKLYNSVECDCEWPRDATPDMVSFTYTIDPGNGVRTINKTFPAFSAVMDKQAKSTGDKVLTAIAKKIGGALEVINEEIAAKPPKKAGKSAHTPVESALAQSAPAKKKAAKTAPAAPADDPVAAKRKRSEPAAAAVAKPDSKRRKTAEGSEPVAPATAAELFSMIAALTARVTDLADVVAAQNRRRAKPGAYAGADADMDEGSDFTPSDKDEESDADSEEEGSGTEDDDVEAEGEADVDNEPDPYAGVKFSTDKCLDMRMSDGEEEDDGEENSMSMDVTQNCKVLNDDNVTLIAPPSKRKAAPSAKAEALTALMAAEEAVQVPPPKKTAPKPAQAEAPTPPKKSAPAKAPPPAKKTAPKPAPTEAPAPQKKPVTKPKTAPTATIPLPSAMHTEPDDMDDIFGAAPGTGGAMTLEI